MALVIECQGLRRVLFWNGARTYVLWGFFLSGFVGLGWQRNGIFVFGIDGTAGRFVTEDGMPLRDLLNDLRF